MDQIHFCEQCAVYFAQRKAHVCTNQVGGAPSGPDIDTSVFQEFQRAHRGTMRSYIHYPEDDETDLLKKFTELNEPMVKLIK